VSYEAWRASARWHIRSVGHRYDISVCSVGRLLWKQGAGWMGWRDHDRMRVVADLATRLIAFCSLGTLKSRHSYHPCGRCVTRA
jgi:hypothetical protein